VAPPGTVPRPGTGIVWAGIYAGNSLTCGNSVLGFQDVELLPAPNISLKAAMNRFISSGVPTDTRRCSTIGGNLRPTRTPFFSNSSMMGMISRRTWTMKKFASDGMTL